MRYDILITGATGFIGSNLIKFYKNKKILLITRRNFKIKSKLVKKLYYKNFRDLSTKLKKIKADKVIHCATHYSKNHNLDEIENMIRANILLGNILLELSEKMSVKKFINISSIWEKSHINSPNDLNLYTLTKYMFSEVIKFYSYRYKGIKFFTLYLSDTFGKNDKRVKLMNVLKTSIKTQKKVSIVSKNLMMNLLNVKDVISSIDLVEKQSLKAGNYLICNKKSTNINAVLKKFNSLSEKKINYKFLGKKKIITKIPRVKKLPRLNIKFSHDSDIVNFLKN